MFANFSIFKKNILCASPTTTFLVLMHCLHYCVASLTMVTVGQWMQALPVDHSEQLPDSISTCDVNSGYYILLLFLFVLLLFFVRVCFFCFCFFQGQQHDFYRYSRVQILCCYYSTNELGKTLSYKGLRQLRLISFQ